LISVKISGVRTVGKKLDRKKEQLEENIMEEIIKTALVDIETPAKKKCHVDTGRLRASIHTEYIGKKQYNYKDNIGNSFDGALSVKLEDDEVLVGTNVEYGQKMEAIDPYLFPAFESSKAGLRSRLRNIKNKL